MTTKTIGVRGCGMIAEKEHFPALADAAGLDLYAVYDTSFDRWVVMQNRFHIEHARPTEQKFWESEIDSVLICTPASLHKE